MSFLKRLKLLLLEEEEDFERFSEECRFFELSALSGIFSGIAVVIVGVACHLPKQLRFKHS